MNSKVFGRLHWWCLFIALLPVTSALSAENAISNPLEASPDTKPTEQAVAKPNETSPTEPPSTLAEQLERIALEQRIDIAGIYKTKGVAAVQPIEGTLKEQLKYLLTNFNYLFVEDADHKLERIVLLRQKQDNKLLPTILATSRQGEHHFVQAVLGGNDGVEQSVKLMVDTGASSVILPLSMLKQLKLNPDDFKERVTQTANGAVPAQLGKLPFLRLGLETLNDVSVAFIEDDKLGDAKLLGMSVLGRYQVSIDNNQNQIMLTRQQK